MKKVPFKLLFNSLCLFAVLVTSSVCHAEYVEKFNSEGKVDNWQHYWRGLDQIKAKEWRQAEQEFNFYINADNASFLRHMAGVAYFGRGLMYQAMGRTEQSIEEFKMAMSRDWHPDYKITDKAWMNIGTIYMKQKNYKEAFVAYEKAVSADHENGQAQYYLGLAAVHLGDLDRAEKQSIEAKKLGIHYTGLDEMIADRKNNPNGKPTVEAGDRPAIQQKKSKTKTTKKE